MIFPVSERQTAAMGMMVWAMINRANLSKAVNLNLE
jgi:hypothetical protein